MGSSFLQQRSEQMKPHTFGYQIPKTDFRDVMFRKLHLLKKDFLLLSAVNLLPDMMFLSTMMFLPVNISVSP